MEGAHELAVSVDALRPRLEELVEVGLPSPRVNDCSLVPCGVFGTDGVVALAGGEELFPIRAAAHDPPACGGGAAAGAGVGFPPPLEVAWAGFLVAEGFRGKAGRGCPCVLRPLFEAPHGRVVIRGGRVGRKSLPPAGAVQVGGRPFDIAGGHRVDHHIVRVVSASRLVRCRGQRSSPWVVILQAMRERHRGQIERWRNFAVRR